MNRTSRFVFRRLIQVVPTAVVVVLLSFLMLKLAPGDLVDVIAGQDGGATKEYMEELRHLYGLDVPSYEQFWNFLVRLAHFNLGYSFHDDMPVSQLIEQRLPATLLLSLTSIAFALMAGVFLGVLAAKYRGTLIDTAISIIATIGFATPLFWVGLMLIVAFAIQLRLFPVNGMVTVGMDYDNNWGQMLDILHHLVLPAVTLGCFFLSTYVRLTRSAMLEVYGLDFVRNARAKGLSELRVVVRHVLRNALLPVVTITGLQLGALFGGTVVIETVFGWPGIGLLAYEAVTSRDINLFCGIFLCSSLLVIGMNLAIDLLYAMLDPRIEIGR